MANPRKNLTAIVQPQSGAPLLLELRSLVSRITITTPVGTAVAQLVASGGTGPYAYTDLSGTLAPYFAINATTGVITVASALTQMSRVFVAEVQDSVGAIFDHAFSLSVIGNMTVIAGSPPVLELNFSPPALSTSYQFRFQVAGNVGAVAFTLLSGSLPAGLTLTGTGANAGRIGTATTVTSVPLGGTYYYFTVRATDTTTGETLDIPTSLFVIQRQSGHWVDYSGGPPYEYPYNSTMPPIPVGTSVTYRFSTTRGRGIPPYTWTWGGAAALTPFVTLTPVNGTLDCDVTIYGDPSLILPSGATVGRFLSLHCVDSNMRAMDFPGTTGYTPTDVFVKVIPTQPGMMPQLSGVDVGTQFAPFRINFAGAGIASVTNTDSVWTVTVNATVSSVGLSLPSIFTVTGSPVTGAGTLTATLANQNANAVFAGPASGSAAPPTFRPLAIADMPATLQRMVSAQAPGVLTPDTINNTTTATAFATSYTIAAADIKAGCLIRVRAHGSYGTTLTPTITVQLRLSNTNVLTVGAYTLPASAPSTNSWEFEGDIFIPSIGASTACRANGHMFIGGGAAAAGAVILPQSTALSLATNVSKQVQLFVTWGTASVSNTITLQQLDVEVLGP